MKQHENILVFSEGTTVHDGQSMKKMPYYPQTFRTKTKKVTKKPSEITDAFFAARKSHGEFERDTTGYPTSILNFDTDQLGLHPTAKPIALFEFLIQTYTKTGECVLDNCVGSGTTGVACANIDRKFIGMEKDELFYKMALERIDTAYQQRKMYLAQDPLILLETERIL